MQTGFQQLCIEQSPDETQTTSGVFERMLQGSVGLGAALARLNQLPRPSKPLGQVGN